MAAFNNHNQQRISQGMPQGIPQGSWLNHGAQNNLATPQQLNQYQYGHQAQIVQPQNHFQMQQHLIWAQQEAQAQQQRLRLAQEQRQQQQNSQLLQQQQQPHIMQQRHQQQQPHMLQQRHQQQPHMLQQSRHQQQHPHTLQQSHGQQNPQMSQQGHILQQNQQQQPHVLQQRHQQQPHQQQQQTHMLQRGQRQQPHVLQQSQQQQSHILQQRHQQSQQHPHILQQGPRQQHHVLQQNQQQQRRQQQPHMLQQSNQQQKPHSNILQQDPRQQPHVLQQRQMDYPAQSNWHQNFSAELGSFDHVGSIPHPGSQQSNPPTIVAASPQSRTQLNQVSNRTPNRSNPNLVQGSATNEEVPCIPNLESLVTYHSEIMEYLDTVEAAEPSAATSESFSRSIPVLIESSHPIILVPSMPSLGPGPEPRPVPEPETSTSSMPRIEPRSVLEPEASSSSMPRPESRFLPEPEASTSIIPSMPSLGLRSVPETEGSISSTTRDLKVNGKLCTKRKHNAEEKTSSLPIIESGSGSEPSPSTSRRSSTASDLELNDEIVGGKKRKRKPKPTYRALAESDSTEYETDDEGPRKVQKTKFQSTKLRPKKSQSTKLHPTKGTMEASPSSKAARAASQDLSKSEIRKSKAWQTRWIAPFDKSHFKTSNKHLDHIFTSKSFGFETKKKFVKGEEKDVISDNKNCNIENIVPKTKCSVCEGKRENPNTKCKHLVNDNSDSDYHSNSDNTLNYNAESQMDYSSGEGQVDTQQNHSEPKAEYVIQFKMHFDLGLPEAQIDPEQDHSKFQKTPLSYTQMAVVAILSTEHQKMSSYEMYTFIKEIFPFYKTKSWKSSLRHTLSGHKFFEDTKEVHNNGKQGRNGSYWILSTSKTSEIKREMKQCWNKNKEIILASTSDPERIAKIFEECDALKSIQESPKKPQKCQDKLKRALTNPQLVVLAIKNSPDGLVNTDELYNFCVENFSDCSTLQSNFKNNFRHTLTFFAKYSSKEGGKNKYGIPLNPEKANSMVQEVQNYCSKNHEKVKSAMIYPDQFSKIIFNIEDIVEAVEQKNTSNFIEVEGLESKTEPRPKPELIKSKSEPRTKPEPIKTKLESRPKPQHIDSKPEPRLKPELIESKPESRPKPEEKKTFSMPIIEFGSGIEPSTSTSSRDRRNRGGY